MGDEQRSATLLTLRPVWLQLACTRCSARAAVKLSDLFSHHLADYALYRCPNCNTVRSFERFGDPAAFSWRRRTIYLEIQAALERLTPARLARDPQAASRPRERIARCVRELETLDRYHGRTPPRCEECGVEHEAVEPERPHELALTCAECGEHPLSYRVVFAAPRGARPAFDAGVACPVCGGTIHVAALVARPSAAGDEVRCGDCGLVLATDVDLRTSVTRTVVRSMTLTASSAALAAARPGRGASASGGASGGASARGAPPADPRGRAADQLIAVAMKRAALKRGSGTE